MHLFLDFRRLTKLHFAILLVILMNFILFRGFDIGLHVMLIFWLKLIWFLLGMLLFFPAFKKSKGLRLYFSFFVFYPIIVAVAWLLDRLMGAILASFIVAFLYFPEPALQASEYSFYNRPTGFLAPCCREYYIVQNTFFIFQKRIGEVKMDESMPIDHFQFKVIGRKGYLSPPNDTGRTIIVDLRQ